MPVTDMEFAFPINLSKPTKAVEAIHAVVKITKEYALNGNYILTCMALVVSKTSEACVCYIYIQQYASDLGLAIFSWKSKTE